MIIVALDRGAGINAHHRRRIQRHAVKLPALVDQQASPVGIPIWRLKCCIGLQNHPAGPGGQSKYFQRTAHVPPFPSLWRVRDTRICHGKIGLSHTLPPNLRAYSRAFGFNNTAGRIASAALNSPKVWLT